MEKAIFDKLAAKNQNTSHPPQRKKAFANHNKALKTTQSTKASTNTKKLQLIRINPRKKSGRSLFKQKSTTKK